LIILIGYLDYITGPEIAIILLYILPIALAVWYAENIFGIFMSIISAIAWFSASYFSTPRYSHPIIPYWNALVMLAIFSFFSYLLSVLRKALEREKMLSRIDALTGAMNSRSFYELAEMELTRAARYRHPFAVSYLDLDNFKYVNDHFGHAVGDTLLKTVTNTLRESLRASDIFARLGGDEFAIIIPEAGDEASIYTLLSKVQINLLETMKKNDWPVTFSIGAVIFQTPPHSVDEMIHLPDKIMYSIKHSGKNRIKLEVFVDSA
jgi:diguanylate cyclase (GGDEF)-like protein